MPIRGSIMSKFSYEGKVNEGKSKLPLSKRLNKAFFNVKVTLLGDKESEIASVCLSDRVLK